MTRPPTSKSRPSVALLAEGVDRNQQMLKDAAHGHVALLAEGVDRNSLTASNVRPQPVALLAEGVDRNNMLSEDVFKMIGRPPRGGRG